MDKEGALAEIICGDSLEVVGDLGKFDYLITDPPYPTGMTGASLRNTPQHLVARSMMDNLFQSFLVGVIKRIRKADSFSIWMFCDWRQVSYFSTIFKSLGWSSQSCIVWDKVAIGLSSKYRSRHELILYASNKPIKMGSLNLGPDIIAVKRVPPMSKTHPFEKPPELVERIAGKFKPGRVLDPFCGTGGLLVGAKSLGWEVVGIDVDKDACDIARKRLDNINGRFKTDG